MSTIRLEILTIERKLYDDHVNMVVAPGIEGMFGVLPNHVPLLTALNFGELQIKKDGDPDLFFAIGGGLIEVLPNHVTVLADSAERADEIDISQAEESRRRAQELLAKRGETKEFEKAQVALKRSAVRLKIAKKYGKGRGGLPHQ
jgi:F-type H+-transporting ATPase subunit epsilon